jgi:hypothetical protein
MADRAGDERRDGDRAEPWRLAPVARGYLAIHAPSGRSYRLAATTRAEAEAQVAMLNRGTLDLSA